MINFDFDSVTDCKSLSYAELSELAKRLRAEILDSVSKNGGHLASNLGVVELTLAIHRVFDLPSDKLIFDVSHQSYVHKMLTARLAGFSNLRHEGGVSGFQLRSESEYDFFGGGHSGTSVAAAIGYAEACRLNGSGSYAVAVVGDGSFTNGMIYEALNNAAKENLHLVVIINDNEMSISENVGAMSKYFGILRTSVKYYKLKRHVKNGLTKIKFVGKPIAFMTRAVKNVLKRILFNTNLFEHLGIDYMGPVDGHDIKKLEAVLKEAKLLEKPVIVHVCTQKGKGYGFAEEKPELYHSVSGFDKEKGIETDTRSEPGPVYTDFSGCFGNTLKSIAEFDRDVVAISAAMCDGTGLAAFRETYPERFYDVGIAEEYAVTFAAGLAASGKKPVVAIYSSFLQRAYDQIIHDVAIQKLHVVFAIDRAGFVPGDGATHQGIFDCAFLLQIPGMTVYTPENYSDLEYMLKLAVDSDGPVAVRYPKGCEKSYDRSVFTESEALRTTVYGRGRHVTVITYGRTAENACDAAKLLENEFKVSVISLKRVKPVDTGEIRKICEGSELIVVVEESVKTGGVSEYIISELIAAGMVLPKVKILAVDESFPTHASVERLWDIYGFEGENIADTIRKNMPVR